MSKEFGLAYWMGRAAKQRSRALRSLAPLPVHELRVALRRCMSMAADLKTLDPYRGWKQMRRTAKQIFKPLGKVRDYQVLAGWVQRITAPGDEAAAKLLAFLSEKEKQRRSEASDALRHFNRKQWKAWSTELAERAEKVPADSLACEHMALERWQEANDMYRRARRTRSKVAYHRARIATKRFRYTVENFLPGRHAHWGADFKQVQDWLGEVHDLDVLWRTALGLGLLRDPQQRAAWQSRIETERKERLDKYRKAMSGKHSLWMVWRAGLPSGEALEQAAVAKLGAWAAFVAPDFEHAERVARIAEGLFEGLAAQGIVTSAATPRVRHILRAAALLHEVGRAEDEKGYHKASHRMIGKLSPPMGWSSEDLQMVALVARYHRGALPRPSHSEFHSLSPLAQRTILLLAGTLRLANMLDRAPEGTLERFDIQTTNGCLIIRAEGGVEEEPLASKLARARHLLEIACHRPIQVLSRVSAASPAPSNSPGVTASNAA